jgi:cobalamin biosynthetic protein CobC
MNAFSKVSGNAEFNHGGQLENIKRAYPNQALPWIDLSTGISPYAYTVSDNDIRTIDLKCLPQDHNCLTQAAYEYYGTKQLSVIPGSMWAIQMLPVIRKLTANDPRPVLLPRQGFNEHGKAWTGQGYNIETYERLPTLDQLNRAQVCIVINPNNPTGSLIEMAELTGILNILSASNAWLIVDEAFIDPYQNLKYSMSSQTNKEGLIVLRSFGKFFGLAGLRLGAILANKEIQIQVSMMLNNWSLSNVSQAIGQKAWQDKAWQAETKDKLIISGERLQTLFTKLNYKTVGTVFFQTLYMANAKEFYQYLLSSGIYTRFLDKQDGVRFGLPSLESQWERLELVITSFKSFKSFKPYKSLEKTP